MALWHWGCGLWCWRACGGVARPRPMEHDAQPYECDQRKLVEEKMRDHGNPPYRWRNEGILPGFRRWELAAGWRYTTSRGREGHQERGGAQKLSALTSWLAVEHRRVAHSPLRGLPLIMMVESPDFRYRDDSPLASRVHGARLRTIHRQRQMRPPPMIIGQVPEPGCVADGARARSSHGPDTPAGCSQ